MILKFKLEKYLMALKETMNKLIKMKDHLIIKLRIERKI